MARLRIARVDDDGNADRSARYATSGHASCWHARVAPRLSLAQCAALLADARLAVGVDTGLTHLSAALDTPTAALFAATPAWRFGPFWTGRAVSLGQDGVWPSAAQVLAALAGLEALR